MFKTTRYVAAASAATSAASVSQDFIVCWLKASILLPPECVITTLHTLLSLPVTLGIFGYVLSFYSGTQSYRNGEDQPEHWCQSQSDLPIPDSCGNTIMIKSLSSPLTLTMITLQLWA